MAFAQTYRRDSGGSGPTETLRWAQDLFEQAAAWTAGSLDLPLSQTPVDADAIRVISEITPLYPGIDYQVLNSPDRIRILFGEDPATDTDDGIWHFFIQYPYIV